MFSFLRRYTQSPLLPFFLGKGKKNIPLFLSTTFFSLLSAISETSLFLCIILAFSVLDKGNVDFLNKYPLLTPITPWLKSFSQSTLFLGIILMGIGTQILRALMAFFARWQSAKLALTIQNELQEKAYAQLLSLSYPCVNKYPAGTLNEIVRSPSAIIQPALEQITELLINGFIVLISVGMMIKLSFGLTALSFSAFSTYLFFQKYILKKLSSHSNAYVEQLNEFSQLTVQYVSGLRVIHAFNVQNFVKSKVRLSLKQIAKFRLLITKHTQGITAFVEILNSLVVCGLIFLGFLVFQIESNPAALSLLMGFLGISYRMGGRIQLFSQQLAGLSGLTGHFSLLEKFLLPQGKEFIALHNKTNVVFNEKIKFSNVNFCYPGCSENSLKNISFSIPHGETIAIVGKSGSGKSTLMDLLLGLYLPTQGDILIDQKQLTKANAESWRTHLSVVHQDPFILNTSIRENLLFGNPNATEEEMLEATKLAHADIFIEPLPNKYETVVGERGYRLSGGERQRLSLAQALLRKPEVLILDEATSHLDTESESFVQDSIRSLPKDMTVIIVAHRLSTIKHADKILVMHNGALVEFGTHDELISEKGSYHNFWALQQKA